MFCYHCGANITDLSSYCPNCGANQNNSVNQKETIQTPVIDLLQSIKVLLDPLKNIYELDDQKNKLSLRIEKGKSFWKNKKRLALIILAVVLFLVMALPTIGHSVQDGIFLSPAMVIIIIFMIIILLHYGYTKTKCKNYANKIEKIDEEISKSLTPIIDKLKVLPPDYRYSMAAEYIYKCLLNGRTDNMKEAVNLYEEQIHRWKIENYQRELGEIARQQLAISRNIAFNASWVAHNTRFNDIRR